MQSEDPELWSMLTDEGRIDQAGEQSTDVIDSDSDNDDGSTTKEQIHKGGVPQPSLITDKDGPTISVEEVIEIAPGEGKIPIHHSMEKNCEPMAFPHHFPSGRFHLNYRREKRITPLRYFQSRLKCGKDLRFAQDSRYIFFALRLVQKDAVHNAICFSERKAKNKEYTAGQLRNSRNILKFIKDDELFQSVFSSIRGSPQYFHKMQLDVLAKVKRFGVPTFFMTWSAAQFKWTPLIKIVGRNSHPPQFFSDEEIEKWIGVTSAKF